MNTLTQSFNLWHSHSQEENGNNNEQAKKKKAQFIIKHKNTCDNRKALRKLQTRYLKTFSYTFK